MKAAVFYGKRDLRVEDVPKPAPAVGEALVKVLMAGLCGSDLQRYTGSRNVPYLPVIPGHEYFGRIEELGPDTTRFSVGDLVTGKPYTTCGTCLLCRTGHDNLCGSRMAIGQHRPGCFAEYMTVPVSTLYALRSGVNPEDAVMAEPTGIALRAIRKAGDVAGKRVTVIGAGAMGLLILKMCIRSGTLCFACDVVPGKLDIAKRFGAVGTVNALETDPVARIKELTGNLGADVVIETAGLPKTLEQAVDMAAYAGRVVCLGLSAEAAGIPPHTIAQKELMICGVVYYVEEFGESVDMINAGKIDYTGLVSHILPLSRIREGFEILLEGRDAVKILIDMGFGDTNAVYRT